MIKKVRKQFATKKKEAPDDFLGLLESLIVYPMVKRFANLLTYTIMKTSGQLANLLAYEDALEYKMTAAFCDVT